MTSPLYEACKKAMHVITSDSEILCGGRAMIFVLKGNNWVGVPISVAKTKSKF